MGTRQIITPTDRDHWLAERAKDLTSTEVPALFHISPYQTELEVWHRHRNGEQTEIVENDRMKWGNRLESAIAMGAAQDHGWHVRPFKEYMRIPDQRLGSSFDFRILAGGRSNVAETIFDTELDAHLEIKNVDSLIFKENWDIDDDGCIEAPPHIELQVQHQMLVSGLNRAFICALVGGNRVFVIEREADTKVQNAILTRAAKFWASIDNNEPPEPDFSRDADLICRLYGFAEPGRVLDMSYDSDLQMLAESYRSAAEMEKLAQEQKKEAKAKMLMMVGDAEKVTGAGFSLSCGMIGPTLVEAYERAGYRNFRVNWPRAKK